ncbi:MAG: hypothetical protein HQ582_17835 [Planctomycetes bacterium]|nr:hypothetical protein [Planctomycetota bacterium]
MGVTAQAETVSWHVHISKGMSHMGCSLGTFLVVSCMVLGELDADEIAAIERRVIANRLAMHQWRIRVSFTRESKGTRREPDAPVGTGYTFYLDGKRSRVDWTFRYIKKPPGIDEGSYTSTAIWSDDQHIDYSTQCFEDGAKSALEVADREWSLKNEANGEIRLPPLRALGMLPFGLLINGTMTDCIGNPNRTELRMSDDIVDGIKCKKISFVSEGGLPSRVWVAPDMGPSVVRMEQEWKAKSHNYFYRTDVVVEEYRNTGIWFPVSAEWRQSQDGNDSTMREAVQVEILSLNEPLDPKFFTIADLNVPAGSFVNKRPSTANHIWDAEQVVNENSAELLDQRGDENGTSGRRIALLGTALLLAVLCGVFLWRHFVRE